MFDKFTFQKLILIIPNFVKLDSFFFFLSLSVNQEFDDIAYLYGDTERQSAQQY